MQASGTPGAGCGPDPAPETSRLVPNCRQLSPTIVSNPTSATSPALRRAKLPAPMFAMFAHITALEVPVVWFAFAAGLALGIAGTFLVMRRRFASHKV
ncbi:MAG: hypothetical protein ABIP94_10335 [Planctomycetota bacterium]